MRAGPKAAVTAAPLDLSKLPKAGGARVIRFIETYLHVTKGTGARKRFKLRDWQKDIICELFDGDRPRQGLLSLPRGNGKSSLAAALALYGLFADNVEGAQVLCVASDQRQAEIVFSTARRMIELEPRLAEQVQIFRDKIYVPRTDSTLMPLPAEPGALQGYDPSLCIVDELHVVTEACWDAMSLASGKRDRSLILAISTPGADSDSVMGRLVEHGRADDDPSFFFREYAAPVGCDLDDEDAWTVANPALDDFLHRDALRATRKTSREAAFRRYRLGQWAGEVEQWLPDGAWPACTDVRGIGDGEEVVLALDGSYNNDTTAIVAATVGDHPHLIVVGCWDRPDGVQDWQVPILDVEQKIRDACARWQVREIVADPFRWARSLQILEAERLPVLAFPQSPQRMTPATTRLYEAVVNHTVTHDGDGLLARHIGNCRLKVDARGTRLAKEHRFSSRKIDLAIAAVMAHDRAAQVLPVVRPMIF